jgi:hypothetical protein
MTFNDIRSQADDRPTCPKCAVRMEAAEVAGISMRGYRTFLCSCCLNLEFVAAREAVVKH